MSKLDDLSIERQATVEHADLLKRRIKAIKERLEETLPHREYTELLEERATSIEALRALESKCGELNKAIQAEKVRENSAAVDVSVDDTAALLRIAADVIGQIDQDDLSDTELAFLRLLQLRVRMDRERALFPLRRKGAA